MKGSPCGGPFFMDRFLVTHFLMRCKAIIYFMAMVR
jgi:hypothetical protein